MIMRMLFWAAILLILPRSVESASVEISAPDSAIIGKTLSVSLRASGAAPYRFWQASLEFDPKVLQLESQSRGVVSGGILDANSVSAIDMIGEVHGAGSVPDSAGQDDVLATYVFRVLDSAATTTDLSVRAYSAANPWGCVFIKGDGSRAVPRATARKAITVSPDPVLHANPLTLIHEGSTIFRGRTIDLGLVDVGSTRDIVLDAHNGGPDRLTLLGNPKVRLHDPSGMFSIVSQPAATTLDANQTTRFVLRYAPTAIANHSADKDIATISIACDEIGAIGDYRASIVGFPTSGAAPRMRLLPPDESTVPSTQYNTYFGSRAVGQTTETSFSMANVGRSTLNLTGSPLVQLTGSTAFSVIQSPPSSLAPAAVGVFWIRFAPSTAGRHSATVSIASNDPTTSPYRFAIAGDATVDPSPRLIVMSASQQEIPNGSMTTSSGNGTHLGDVSIGANKAVSFRLINFGDGPLLLPQVPTVLLTGDPDFTIFNAPSSRIDSFGTLGIDFVPTAMGRRSATVTIVSNDPTNPTYRFAISGSGSTPLAPPRLRVTGLGQVIASGDVSPSRLDGTDMGSGLIGSKVEATFVLTNDGQQPLQFSGFPPIGLDGSQAFTLRLPNLIQLLAGESCLCAVVYSPQSAGPENATFQIRSNDPAVPNWSCVVQGSGVSPSQVLDQLDYHIKGIAPDAATQVEVRVDGVAQVVSITPQTGSNRAWACSFRASPGSSTVEVTYVAADGSRKSRSFSVMR